MKKAELKEVAVMVAQMLKGTAPIASEMPLKASRSVRKAKSGSDDLPVIVTPINEEQEHFPSCSPHQVADMLNDVRFEVRIQRKYPLIEALENAFKKKDFITAGEMKRIVETLKSNGKYWPRPVLSCLNEAGQRLYMNNHYDQPDGAKWKYGSLVEFKTPRE